MHHFVRSVSVLDAQNHGLIVNVANSDDLLAVLNEPIAVIVLSRLWRNGVRTFMNNDVFFAESLRSTGPPPLPVVMVIQRSCGPQSTDYCNPLHVHLEPSTPRQI